MSEDKFAQFLDFVDSSFQEVIREMAGFQVSKCNELKTPLEKKFSVVIGIVLGNRGAILFEAEQSVIDKITEGMNGEPLTDMMDTYLYLAEFTNTFCGNAVSQINNSCKNNELRLTPPAIFVGTDMRIITPSIESSSIYYTCEFGQVILNIGFEGV